MPKDETGRAASADSPKAAASAPQKRRAGVKTAEREARLAEALRANLRRRKAAPKEND